jgi:hypothetical protein
LLDIFGDIVEIEVDPCIGTLVKSFDHIFVGGFLPALVSLLVVPLVLHSQNDGIHIVNFSREAIQISQIEPLSVFGTSASLR